MNFSCVLLYRRDLLFLQHEVYSLHFLVWKAFTFAMNRTYFIKGTLYFFGNRVILQLTKG